MEYAFILEGPYNAFLFVISVAIENAVMDSK